MSQGAGPAGTGGAVFRLVHKNFYTAGLPIPIQPEAFRPTDRDTDGLSVFLEGEATPEQALSAVSPAKRDLYYVARIPIPDLQQLGLSVRAAPTDEVPGHAVIPELSTEACGADSQGRSYRSAVRRGVSGPGRPVQAAAGAL
jgi:hypothetical protein